MNRFPLETFGRKRSWSDSERGDHDDSDYTQMSKIPRAMDWETNGTTNARVLAARAAMSFNTQSQAPSGFFSTGNASVPGVYVGTGLQSVDSVMRDLQSAMTVATRYPAGTPPEVTSNVLSEIVSNNIESIIIQSMPWENNEGRNIKEGDIIFFLRTRKDEEKSHSISIARTRNPNVMAVANLETVYARMEEENRKLKKEGKPPAKFTDFWRPLGVVRSVSAPADTMAIFTVCVKGTVNARNIWGKNLARESAVGICDYVRKDAKDHGDGALSIAFPNSFEISEVKSLGAFARANLGAHSRYPARILEGPILFEDTANIGKNGGFERDLSTFLRVGTIVSVQNRAGAGSEHTRRNFSLDYGDVVLRVDMGLIPGDLGL